jgi:hypothetical protein
MATAPQEEFPAAAHSTECDPQFVRGRRRPRAFELPLELMHPKRRMSLIGVQQFKRPHESAAIRVGEI